MKTIGWAMVISGILLILFGIYRVIIATVNGSHIAAFLLGIIIGLVIIAIIVIGIDLIENE